MEALLPPTLTEAHAAIIAMQARLNHLEQRVIPWAEGRRGNGVRKAKIGAEVFTESETEILRILASTGGLAHNRLPAQQRHMSNIRKKLAKANCPVSIKTHVGDGYEVTSGRALLRRAVAGESKVKTFAPAKTAGALEAAA